MPLPAELQAVADELAALYAETQAALAAELAQVVGDPNRRSQVARLRELIRTTRTMRTELEAGTRDWLQTSLAQVHAAGAEKAAADAGSAFAWTTPHVEAVQALASTTWTDVAANLRGMETETRRALRGLTRDAAREVLLEGKSSAQVAGGIERWMGENGLGTVTYGNGARHLAADYADTVARTTTANAYNEGTFTQLEADDIGWAECSDGPACGLRSHNDAEKANGKVYPLAVARQYPIAHPRCVMPDTPVLPHGAWVEAVRARYSGPKYTITASTSAGAYQMSVGPHHPVLTGVGWKAAHLVAEGDQLVYDCGLEHAGDVRGEPDLDEMPRAEDVFQSLWAVGARSSVPAASDDLHGDGMFCTGEVDVVVTAGGLLGVGDAALVEHGGELDLMGSDGRLAFVSKDSGADSFLDSVAALSGRCVGCGRDAFDFSGARREVHSLPAVGLGFGHGAREVVVSEETTDGGTLDAHDLGDFVTCPSLIHVQGSNGIEVESRYAGDRAVAGVRSVGRCSSELGSAGFTEMAGGECSSCVLGAPMGAVAPRPLDREGGGAELARAHCPGHRFLSAVVVRIEVSHHDGWVYDFTTTGGTFLASRIIVKNCARSWSGRPDVTNATQAEAGRLFTPQEQARQAAEETARDAASPRTLTGRARVSRTARTTRTARTPRAASKPPAT